MPPTHANGKICYWLLACECLSGIDPGDAESWQEAGAQARQRQRHDNAREHGQVSGIHVVQNRLQQT